MFVLMTDVTAREFLHVAMLVSLCLTTPSLRMQPTTAASRTLISTH
jgi:hypothetical protein